MIGNGGPESQRGERTANPVFEDYDAKRDQSEVVGQGMAIQVLQ
jgi:hypothetical protein